MKELLSVKGLVLEAHDERGPLRPADDVSFSVDEGETLGIIGESGSGKTLTMTSLIGLLPPGVRMVGGEIWFKGELISRSQAEFARRRGTEVGFVFQDPMSGLNPAFTVGNQLAELLRVRGKMRRKPARMRAEELLRQVKVSSPRERLDQYPHELSGGIRQRILIAMAISLQPSLLVADEPTTALDTTVQAEVFDLLANIRGKSGLAMLLVTHDLGVAAALADRVAVMYAGRIVETGALATVLAQPQHPYTAMLVRAVPSLRVAATPRPIEGAPPSLSALPPGCAFHPRCPLAAPRCQESVPGLHRRGTGSSVSACHFAEDVTSAFGFDQEAPVRRV